MRIPTLLMFGATLACTGEVSPGDAAGDPATAGDTVSGDPMAGDPASGDPPAGDTSAGDPAAGDPTAAGDGGDMRRSDADNSAPSGAPDHYDTFLDSPIQVPAPGVLANDTDPQGDLLSAELVSDVAHGQLSLRADGSFDYTPAPGFTGSDAFTYSPSDGSSLGDTVTVTVATSLPTIDPTLVILAFHPDSTAPQPTVPELEGRMDTVREYFLEYSYNRHQHAGVLHPDRGADVVGWYETQGDCFDQGELMDLANADVDFTQYRRLIFVLAQRSGCSLSAWGSIGGMVVNTPDGSVYAGVVRMNSMNAGVGTLTHEIGHTLNNGHARFLDCGDVSWAESGCTQVTYGDPYDVMSLGIGHFTARRKGRMGWLDPISNRVLLVQGSGSYVIDALETNSGGVKALEIPRDLDFPLLVEYRQPIGTDTSFGVGADAFEGALLRVGDGLIDATPPPGTYGPTPPGDAELTPALHVGESWVDPLTGTTVTVTGNTATHVMVDVQVVE